MIKEQENLNSYLVPGTSVRYDGMQDEPEYGVVVHCWFDDNIQNYDCYIAFFGNAQPEGAPKEKPYILRYASTSLKKVA